MSWRPAYRYLHLATHGFFAPAGASARRASAPEPGAPGPHRPVRGRGGSGFHPGLLSGLALAGADRPAKPGEDDGILTALEVADLDLANVELVTLSACETGLGAVAGGEGVLGLQRAFQAAGARSVVSSLWSVDDAATRALMVDFYDNLWHKKLPKLEALRQTQLRVLREGRKWLPRPARAAGLKYDEGYGRAGPSVAPVLLGRLRPLRRLAPADPARRAAAMA